MRTRTIAILRGEAPARSVALATACWDAGFDLVEVPVQGDAGWEAFAAVARASDGRAFGAGTVLTRDDTRRAVDAGAAAIISPGVVDEVITESLQSGVLPLPGVMTPTDVARCVALGATTCKFFPASVLGPAWLPALRGPFPDVRFIAVGGVSESNASEFLAAGAAGVAFGSNVADLLARPDAGDVLRRLNTGAG